MTLTIYPAIDLKGGQVVRLAEGDMARATVYADDPAEQARRFAEDGAAWIHVVDLDGAFAGEGRNVEAVRAILAAVAGTGVRVQVGGGIRNREAAERWFDAGAARVVIGTAALEQPDLVRETAGAHAGGVVVAVDARGGRVATRGWADVSDVTAADLGRRFEDAGVAGLLFTDVGRDGLLKGVNVEATTELARAVAIPVIASGGAAGVADVAACRSAGVIEGVVIGRALYDGRLTLKHALEAAR